MTIICSRSLYPVPVPLVSFFQTLLCPRCFHILIHCSWMLKSVETEYKDNNILRSRTTQFSWQCKLQNVNSVSHTIMNAVTVWPIICILFWALGRASMVQREGVTMMNNISYIQFCWDPGASPSIATHELNDPCDFSCAQRRESEDCTADRGFQTLQGLQP